MLKAYKDKSQQLFDDEENKGDMKSIEIEQSYATLENGLQCGVQKNTNPRMTWC